MVCCCGRLLMVMMSVWPVCGLFVMMWSFLSSWVSILIWDG